MAPSCRPRTRHVFVGQRAITPAPLLIGNTLGTTAQPAARRYVNYGGGNDACRCLAEHQSAEFAAGDCHRGATAHAAGGQRILGAQRTSAAAAPPPGRRCRRASVARLRRRQGGMVGWWKGGGRELVTFLVRGTRKRRRDPPPTLARRPPLRFL